MAALDKWQHPRVTWDIMEEGRMGFILQVDAKSKQTMVICLFLCANCGLIPEPPTVKSDHLNDKWRDLA